MNKKENTSDFLIINQTDYKDYDAIINALSSKGQYISFYARGIRKNTSKNAAALQAFMFSSITYFESDKSLHSLKSANGKETYYDKFKTYDEIVTGYLVLDVINNIAKDLITSDIKVYDLLIDSLNNISGITPSLFISSFLAKVMKLLGLSLVCDSCALCSKTSVNYISVEHGGFICHSCLSDNNKHNSTVELLKLFRLVNKVSYSELKNINVSELVANDLLIIMYEFYISYSSFTIRNINQFISDDILSFIA